MSLLLAIAAAVSSACPAGPLTVSQMTLASVKMAESSGWNVESTADVVRGVHSDDDPENNKPFLYALNKGCAMTLTDGSEEVQVDVELDEDLRADLLLLTQKIDMNDIWDEGASGQAKLAFIHAAHPTPAVANFVALQFLPFWEESTILNAYKPLRTEIARRYSMAKARADVGEARLERQLLFDALAKVDKHTGGVVPNDLYGWLEP